MDKFSTQSDNHYSVFPFFFKIVNLFLDTLINHPSLVTPICNFLSRSFRIPLWIYTFFFGDPLWKETFGPSYIQDFVEGYLADVWKDPQHMINHIRLFQELDSHSVFHLLPTIQQPTLVVSGLLDLLTPAYQSFEIARRMPNATHCVCPLASHFAVLEDRTRVCKAIVKFLESN